MSKGNREKKKSKADKKKTSDLLPASPFGAASNAGKPVPKPAAKRR
jgi:hypothetical protein